MFLINTPKDKVHKIKGENNDRPSELQQLRNLLKSKPSILLNNYLASLTKQRSPTETSFIEGVKKFIKIANLHPDKRKEFFGTEFGGLHYNNDLAKLTKIPSYQLNNLCPDLWDYPNSDGISSLVYKGTKPSQALNKLLQGPTVIDCGKFCQLGIWFGIRYMLGDKRFDELFGKTPFYLTGCNYNPIKNPEEPYIGNPLYPFFSENLQKKENGIIVTYIENTPLYLLKHPGGLSMGDNCLRINGEYTKFGPLKKKTSGLKRTDVLNNLRESYDKPQDSNDKHIIKSYRKKPTTVHAVLGITYEEIIKQYPKHKYATLSEQAFENMIKKENNLVIRFDLNKFNAWVQKMERSFCDRKINYVFLPHNELEIPKILLGTIPHENRNNMSFSNFKSITAQQQNFFSIASRFCLDVMNKQPCCVMLTGKAGIGKTASAVCCAKELTSRGKKIIWMSEVMMKRWTDQARTMEEFQQCQKEIKLLLQDDIDAVFMDDNNLIGYSGKILLEEVYRWYVSNPGKGLFITSNEEVSLNSCFGLKLDEKFHYPPFLNYDSVQYTNFYIQSGLNGNSMRNKVVTDITTWSDEEKITALKNCTVKHSVGVIVTFSKYSEEFGDTKNIEVVPGFKSFDPITSELIKTKHLGPAYEALSEIQKKWTRRFPVTKSHCKGWRIEKTRIFDYMGIGKRRFETTDCKIIAVELLHATHLRGKEIVNEDCLDQLLRVINYAHDCGDKKVILVNHTKFSHSVLLDKIKEQIPDREKERTFARLNQLLFSEALILPLPQKTKDNNTLIKHYPSQHNIRAEGFLFFKTSYDDMILHMQKEYDYQHRNDTNANRQNFDQQWGLMLLSQ